MFAFRSRQRVLIGLAIALIFLAAALATVLWLASSKDHDILWTIAHDKCVPNEEVHHDPAPCVRVDLAHGVKQGYVILKDLVGVAQFLLIPTRRISGIEAPDLLAQDAPNYWAAAWQNRHFVSARAPGKLDWDMTGLAINSSSARSQDQLHIHIDCLRPDVRTLLGQHVAEIGTNWAKLSFALAGRHYAARRLAAADLITQDPFKLLAEGLSGAGQNTAQETLAVVGVSFAHGRNGFVLLAARGTFAHAEALLDHGCAVGR